jgi:NADP-dependent 3-hydroxy acid dehydrogenase YdfG
MSEVTGKVVAVTGASSGIGEATALELAGRGAAVVLGARRTDRLSALAERIHASGGQAEVLAVDVTRRADLEQLVATAVERFGRLDVLVSNAGIARTGLVGELDVDGWDAMIDVNLRGVLHGIAAALPVFRRQGRGHFVTTVSTSGLKIVPTQAVYAGTKNAVRTLLEAHAKSPPTVSYAPPRSRPATYAPSSSTTSTTPISANRREQEWRNSASARTP